MEQWFSSSLLVYCTELVRFGPSSSLLGHFTVVLLYANGTPPQHYNDVIMTTMASQITSLTVVYSTVYSHADQRKHQSSASLAFVWGIHRGPVNSPHKGPVMRKMFPFDDVIMACLHEFSQTTIEFQWRFSQDWGYFHSKRGHWTLFRYVNIKLGEIGPREPDGLSACWESNEENAPIEFNRLDLNTIVQWDHCDISMVWSITL